MNKVDQELLDSVSRAYADVLKHNVATLYPSDESYRRKAMEVHGVISGI